MAELVHADAVAQGKLDSVTFDRFLAEQNPFGKMRSRLDLSGIRLVTPAALVELASACYALAREGRHPVVAVADRSVWSYLLRSNFVGVVRPVARIEPTGAGGRSMTYHRTHRPSRLLTELTKFESGSALPDLLDQLVCMLCNELGYHKHDAYDVGIAVSEIAQNTFDHNRQTCGFLAMQVYGRGEGRFLEIGVGDHGEGLARSLERNPAIGPIRSDSQAIRKATQHRVSEFDDPTRGTGLYHLLEITYRLGGMVQIRSGAAKVRYRMDKRKGWEFPVPPMPGVQVALTLPAREMNHRTTAA